MSRRGENIYKRRDGRWEARYIKGHTIDGRAIYGYIYRHTYLEAKRAQSEARADCGKPGTRPVQSASPETLESYLNEWLSSIRLSVKKSTYANYDGLIRRHIVPVIGKTPLFQVESGLIQQYINQQLESGRVDKTGGLSPKTARDIVCLLKRSLKAAGIELNIRLPKYSPPKPRVLTEDEQRALIAAAESDGSSESLGILVSLFTGIRLGELCSLKWSDISLDEGLLKISKTIQRIENCEGDGKSKTVIHIGSAKSECAMRSIPLPHSLLHRLCELRKSACEDDYLLSGSNRYVEPRTCQYRFKKLLRQAGIDDINFHVLRHTFATRCIESGIDIKTVSQLLGHSNVNITLDRYVHPAVEYQRDCMEKLCVSFAAAADSPSKSAVKGEQKACSCIQC